MVSFEVSPRDMSRQGTTTRTLNDYLVRTTPFNFCPAFLIALFWPIQHSNLNLAFWSRANR